MIIKNKTADEVVVEGESNIRKATISADKISKLSFILTKALYSDPIAAVVVEPVCNGIDSVVAAGKSPIDHPVIVEIGNKPTGGWFFRVTDTGIGLSDDEFENVFMNYLESSKENDNSQIGAWGLGGKSFISLDRSGEFICRKDGVERKYLAYQGSQFCEYDKLYEKKTKEPNGVIFEIAIKDWSERHQFIEKAKKKLAYFDTVVLIIDGVPVQNIINRQEYFQWSDNAYERNLSLCLKDVHYSINWEKLGIAPINCPIALRFSLTDGLIVTPSRQELIYTEEVKKVILKKIEKTADWFVKKYNETVEEFDNFSKAIPHLRHRGHMVELGGNQIDIEGLKPYSSVPYKNISVKGLEIWTPEQWWKKIDGIGKAFSLIGELKWGGKYATKRMWGDFAYNVKNAYECILVNETPIGRMKGFIQERHSEGKIFIERRMTLHDYKLGLILLQEPKNTWRALIKECQKVIGDIREHFFKDERGIKDRKEYLAYVERKKQEARDSRVVGESTYVTLDKQEGEVTISYARKPLLGSEPVFEKKTYVINDMHRAPYISLLFSEEEKEEAKRYYGLHEHLMVGIIGKRERTRLPELKKIMTKESFEKTKLFRRIVTRMRAEDVLEKWEAISREGHEVVQKCISPTWELQKQLETYCEDNKPLRGVSKEQIESFINTGHEHFLWDLEILPLIEKMERALSTFYFLPYIDYPRYATEEETKSVKRVINQLLLFQKKYGALENFDLVEKEPPVEMLEEQLAIEEEYKQEMCTI